MIWFWGYSVAQDEKKDDKTPSEDKDVDGDESTSTGEAPEGQEGEEGLHPPKRKLTKKHLTLIAIAAVVLLGGAIGAGVYFFSGSDEKSDTEAALSHGGESASTKAHGEKGETDDGDTTEEDPHVAPTFFSLGDILVNLSGDGKRPNFLKITINLELADPKDVPSLEALKPRIVDQFQVYLRELRVEDLRGSAGLYRLREELLLRVTEVIHPIRVRDVLFQELLVQ